MKNKENFVGLMVLMITAIMLPLIVGAVPPVGPPNGVTDAGFNSVSAAAIIQNTNFLVQADGDIFNPSHNSLRFADKDGVEFLNTDAAYEILSESVSMQSGALVVTGSSGNDQMEVASDGDQWKVNVDYNGSHVDELWFEKSIVDFIVVYSMAGNDNIDTRDVDIPTIISGGSGNDNIDTGDGNDTIFGGAGIDQINANAGENIIYPDAEGPDKEDSVVLRVSQTGELSNPSPENSGMVQVNDDFNVLGAVTAEEFPGLTMSRLPSLYDPSDDTRSCAQIGDTYWDGQQFVNYHVCISPV
jgi:RTX calcium-binding nonapeptide repeat (4 copies)